MDCYFAWGGAAVVSIVMSAFVYVCVSVCLSVSISHKPHARSLPNVLYILPTTVSQSSSGRATKSQGEGALLKVFYSIDNALYSIAFGIHTQTA